MKEEGLYREELEALTSKLYKGDFTPLIYDVLKDSDDLPALLKYLTGQEIEEEIVTVVQTDSAPSFEDWFRDFTKIV